MYPSITICPATCELCGQWMPGHSKDCPRSGVHPSQWSITNNATKDNYPMISSENNDAVATVWEENFSLDYHHNWSSLSATRNDNMTISSDEY